MLDLDTKAGALWALAARMDASRKSAWQTGLSKIFSTPLFAEHTNGWLLIGSASNIAYRVAETVTNRRDRLLVAEFDTAKWQPGLWPRKFLPNARGTFVAYPTNNN